MTINFLEINEVKEIHHVVILKYGGKKEIRSKNLLESAIAQAKNVYFYNNAGLIEIAANYGFHLCKNHPFYDGNKRTSFTAMEMFLAKNGYKFKEKLNIDIAEKVMLAIASNELYKDELINWIKLNIVELRPENEEKFFN
ncbi:type II toxin-antitoxin system death-on-curing family toxin [Sporohalobacter salinus]|uniref:type II toxin-antitoxin system death-on-curing family toxin n=1 Tax=Sporohalobacter salinus TaxID=1494606 RepID=UPI00195FDFB6|nr:type II toxin-antitoxin system death-on-curing family toxin [Sporohalobacter salinus]MBM7624933.1 death-on-curing protein [Sporohalobacter salinus]